MANECGCGTSNCECAYKTSDISLWDGVFTNITVPSGASLNDVLALLENYVTTSTSCNGVNYTLSAFSACLNLPAGTYSFTQIIDAIVTRICANASDIAELQSQAGIIGEITTDNVELENIVWPPCFTSSSTLTTSTALFNLILNHLCKMLQESGPVLTDKEASPITYEVADAGTLAEEGETNIQSFFQNTRLEHLSVGMEAILDNNSFVFDHTAPITRATDFVIELQPMKAIVNNFLVVRQSGEDLTVNATKDTYFYLSAGGYILRREVAIAAPAPTTPSGSHLLYVITSDGSGVTGVANQYETEPFTGLVLGANDVDTVNIVDGAVTSAKLDSVVVGKTDGDTQLFELTFNDKGQVTAFNYNISLSGLADGHVLTYNSGTGFFENAANTTMPSANKLPKGNGAGTDLVDSGISEDATLVASEKKVEINSGSLERSSQAGLNIVEGTLLLPRYTAANASALSLVNGTLIYVIDTDATFTSAGFWGVVSGAWTKL